jgi:hypothetical protein
LQHVSTGSGVVHERSVAARCENAENDPPPPPELDVEATAELVDAVPDPLASLVDGDRGARRTSGRLADGELRIVDVDAADGANLLADAATGVGVDAARRNDDGVCSPSVDNGDATAVAGAAGAGAAAFAASCN